MADILSLSKARKAKARVQKDAKATENRIRFGRTKAKKNADQAKENLAERKLDGHKLDD